MAANANGSANMSAADVSLTFDALDSNGTHVEEAEDTVDGKKESWIEKTFHKRTCIQFVPTKKELRRCGCGRLDEDHCREALRTIPSPDRTKWDVHVHTRLEPTDAYGQIEFSGAGQTSRAKYIRVEHGTDPRKLLTLMTQQWGLDLPKLLISVTGGAKSFILHPKLKQVLRQGLLKAARTTGAWIFTGGTNTGVMKHVGEAVRGQMLTSHFDMDQSNRLHLIGIATWGIVDHNNRLQEDKDTVTYHMTSSQESSGASLDNNHTHFILVDDGTKGKYGGEIALRASLENCISHQKISKNKSHGVPVVLLVLEGGMNTIRTVLESVTRSPAVPVVIAEGSGRAADILSYAHRYIVQEDTDKVLQPHEAMRNLGDVVEHRRLLLKIENAFPEASNEKKMELYKEVLDCVGNKRYITIFRVDEEGVDIDRAILRALLKAQHATAADQLSLALVWNRVDIAKSEIFVEGQKWDMESLNAAMMDALINNRVEFVKLLLENGVGIGDFLKPATLLELYRGRAKVSYAFQQVIGEEKFRMGFTLEDINRIVGRMLGGTYKGHSEHSASVMTGLGMFTTERPKFMADFCHFTYPFIELFVWAVLCKMQKMAIFFWERGDHCLAKALVGVRIYMEMAEKIAQDELKTDVLVKVQNNANEFKEVALNLLNECFRANEMTAQKLLTYQLDVFCGHTCLTLAIATEHEEFVAHTCCQSLLTEIWMGAMRSANISQFKIFFGILMPLFIYKLEFKTKEELSLLPVTLVEHMQEMADSYDEEEEEDTGSPAGWNKKGSIKRVRLSTYKDTGTLEQGGAESTRKLRPGSPSSPRSDIMGEPRYKKLGLGRRLLEFYRAPITKFWANVIAYFLFLMLFSFVILVKQPSSPYIAEIVLIIFVFTLCTEEIRQIFQSDSSMSDNRFKAWASSKWNICDGVAVLLFFVGLGLRFDESTRSAGHVIYCLDIMLWIIRLLDIFSVSKHLGPYVVMIGRMTVDMFYFLLVMVIFLLAYGVAQQAILYPNIAASWGIISHIFFRPYFQIYGELFITDPIQLDGNNTEFSTPKFDSYSGTIVTCLMAGYILVANILLLNLLIAIFNNTFSEVQQNSNQIWKFQRYDLIMEYAQRPVLVPPLIFFNHVIEFVIAICHKICLVRKGQHSSTDNRLKLFLNKEDLQKLMTFEEHCMYMHLYHRDTLFNATAEERVRVMGNRVESVITQLEEMDKETFTRDTTTTKTMTTLDKRLGRLEKNTKTIKAILKMLAARHDVTPEHYRATRGDDSEDDDDSGDDSDEAKSSILSHFSPIIRKLSTGSMPSPSPDKSSHFGKAMKKYRKLPSVGEDDVLASDADIVASSPGISATVPQFPATGQQVPNVESRLYPVIGVERVNVPDAFVDWKVPFPGYNPEHPDISSFPAEDVLLLRFNEIDGFVDRRSYTGVYDVIDGLPRNPKGRTGFAGRGLFAHWGPNHTAGHIISRWRLREDGSIEERDGLMVMEFIAIRDANSEIWRIPEGEVRAGQNISDLVKSELVALAGESLEEIAGNEEQLSESLEVMFGARNEVSRGYVDDARNTDNAWLETLVTHIHDEFGDALGKLQPKVPQVSAKAMSWMVLSRQACVTESHMTLLQSAAELNDQDIYF